MAITDWPVEERPREKLIQQGPKSLSDAELLAIFLRVGIKGKSAVEMSRDLLKEFGSLRGLIGADMDDFCSSHGLGMAKYAQLQAVVEMSRRYLGEGVKRGMVVSGSSDLKDYLKIQLREYQYEVFACLYLDNRHRLIEFKELFTGTIDSTTVHPREVVRQAITLNAAAVIFAHNHPSGVAEPSQADINITQTLISALGLIDVRVLDHFVVGDEITSMAERGLM